VSGLSHNNDIDILKTEHARPAANLTCAQRKRNSATISPRRPADSKTAVQKGRRSLSARGTPAKLLERVAEEPADVVLIIDGREVQIQIVEIVDQYDRGLRQVREGITYGFGDQPAEFVAELSKLHLGQVFLG
jgi:hypothetical protein